VVTDDVMPSMVLTVDIVHSGVVLGCMQFNVVQLDISWIILRGGVERCPDFHEERMGFRVPFYTELAMES
jgi:hypothetical protein